MSPPSPPGRPSRPGRLVALAALALAPAAACRGASLPAPIRPEAVAPRGPAPAAGRGSLVGVVADSLSGHPVPGAAVYFTDDPLAGTGRPTRRPDLPADTTGRDGGFTLPDLAPGTYTLVVDGLDHYPMREIVIVRPGLVRSVVLRPRRVAAP